MSSDIDSTRDHLLRGLDAELAELAACGGLGLDSMRQFAEPLLTRAAEDVSLLRALLQRCLTDPTLSRQCERDHDAVKLVLWQCPTSRVALRLHRFLGSGPDRPHSHRWPFTARIISGEYRHVVFLVKGALRSGIGMSDTSVVMDRVERSGSMYSLGTDVMHSVDAARDTFSLVLRGPAVSNRLLVIDQVRADTYWHYGSEEDSAKANRYTNRLSQDDLRQELARAAEIIDAVAMA